MGSHTNGGAFLTFPYVLLSTRLQLPTTVSPFVKSIWYSYLVPCHLVGHTDFLRVSSFGCRIIT